MDGITYYKLKSPYEGDITKNCSLTGLEIDRNNLVLEGRDVKSITVDGAYLVVTRFNGEEFRVKIVGAGSDCGSCLVAGQGIDETSLAQNIIEATGQAGTTKEITVVGQHGGYSSGDTIPVHTGVEDIIAMLLSAKQGADHGEYSTSGSGTDASELEPLQLYRSTETYATKLLAQWLAIGYIDEYTPEHTNQDGEPIVARYYDDLTDLNPNAELEWVAFMPSASFADNLATNNIEVPTGDNPPDNPTWSTTPLFLSNGGTWYKLAWKSGYDTGISDIDTHVSSTFGLFFDNGDDSNPVKTIEWFDNAKEVNECIDHLNYDDRTSTDDDGDHQVVSEVDQTHGQVSVRHATLIVDPSITLSEHGSYGTNDRQLSHGVRILNNVGNGNERYEYVEHIPIENITYTESLVDPTTITPTSNSATYVTYNDQHYYKRSILNQIIYTDGNGLTAKVYVKRVQPDGADANNVREQYALFGADGKRLADSEDIKVYKDNALVKAYLGHVEDSIVGAWVNGSDEVYTNQGSTISPEENITVYSDPACTTALTGTGSVSIDETSTYGGRLILTYGGDVYTVSEADITHKTGTGTLTDALCFIYRQADGTYMLVAIDVDDFLSENEFGAGLQVNDPSKFYENMGTYYIKPKNPITGVDSWNMGTDWFLDYGTAAQDAFAALTQPYIMIGNGLGAEPYVIYQLAGNSKGKVVSVKISNGISNQYLKVDLTGIDAKIFDLTTTSTDDSTGLVDGRQLKNFLNVGNFAEETPKVLTGVVEENGHLEKVTRSLFVNNRQMMVGTTQSGTDDHSTLRVTIYGQDVNIADGTTIIEENVTDIANLISKTFTDPTAIGTELTTPYLEYDGVIYHWNGVVYEPFKIGNGTNEAVALALLNYMAYTIDMGRYNTF